MGKELAALKAQPAPVQEPVAMPENWFAGMPEEYRKEAWRVATPPAAQPAVQEPVAVTYKEVADTMNALWGGTLKQVQIATELANTKLYTTPPAQPAVPDAFGTREGEHPQYIQGWNDCRAEMLKGMK
jgi:hypothetical protein